MTREMFTDPKQLEKKKTEDTIQLRKQLDDAYRVIVYLGHKLREADDKYARK